MEWGWRRAGRRSSWWGCARCGRRTGRLWKGGMFGIRLDWRESWARLGRRRWRCFRKMENRKGNFKTRRLCGHGAQRAAPLLFCGELFVAEGGHGVGGGGAAGGGEAGGYGGGDQQDDHEGQDDGVAGGFVDPAGGEFAEGEAQDEADE